MPALPELLHCDLCILAYQLYHQTVIWPLDPWYEILAHKGSDRRTTFMKKVHGWAKEKGKENQLYGGPAAIKGWGDSNPSLDPVITSYLQLDPRAPAWTRDGENFLAMRAPAYVVDSIRRVSVCTHGGAPKKSWPHIASPEITSLDVDGAGADELIAFEGGTGALDGAAAAWSLMGYVLKRTRPGGNGWDAHIVFRGSRSGWAVRAALQGVMSHAGNPDWVADTGTRLVASPYISKTGKVARGFAETVPRCMGTIYASLRELNRRHGPPKGISVTGHSLGAALAALCCGAITLGTAGDDLRRGLPDWPWDRVRGFFYAEPPVGDRQFAAAFDRALSCKAPFVVGDAVVECAESVDKAQSMMGKIMSLVANGVQVGTLWPMKRPSGAGAGDDSHEIYLIRSALVKSHPNLAFGGLEPAIAKATPWASYASFTDMLAGTARSYRDASADKPEIVTPENLRASLARYRFADHFAVFLDLFKDLVTDKNAYIGYHFKTTYEHRRERLDVALGMFGKNEGGDKALVVDATATQVAALFAYAKDGEGEYVLGRSTDKFIGLGLVLRTLETAGMTTLADFRKVPELEICFGAS